VALLQQGAMHGPARLAESQDSSPFTYTAPVLNRTGADFFSRRGKHSQPMSAKHSKVGVTARQELRPQTVLAGRNNEVRADVARLATERLVGDDQGASGPQQL
jgi:hypothetical protein